VPGRTAHVGKQVRSPRWYAREQNGNVRLAFETVPSMNLCVYKTTAMRKVIVRAKLNYVLAGRAANRNDCANAQRRTAAWYREELRAKSGNVRGIW
jgi:hypothetical protein